MEMKKFRILLDLLSHTFQLLIGRMDIQRKKNQLLLAPFAHGKAPILGAISPVGRVSSKS